MYCDRAASEQNPIQQGLKQSSFTTTEKELPGFRTKSNTTRVETYVPACSEEGGEKASEQNPIQQGLKRKKPIITSAVDLASEQNPIQQGLKPDGLTKLDNHFIISYNNQNLI